VPYPPQALQLHVTGDIRLRITVSAGRITDVQAISGPGILSSAAARWVKKNWEFAPDETGTFTLPMTFQITH
jgi:outer membrane biosynthesis protein TonB